jgi:hypothetical protein
MNIAAIATDITTPQSVVLFVKLALYILLKFFSYKIM